MQANAYNKSWRLWLHFLMILMSVFNAWVLVYFLFKQAIWQSVDKEWNIEVLCSGHKLACDDKSPALAIVSSENSRKVLELAPVPSLKPWLSWRDQYDTASQSPAPRISLSSGCLPVNSVFFSPPFIRNDEHRGSVSPLQFVAASYHTDLRVLTGDVLTCVCVCDVHSKLLSSNSGAAFFFSSSWDVMDCVCPRRWEFWHSRHG